MIVSENRRKSPETPREEGGGREAERQQGMESLERKLVSVFPPLPRPQFPSDGREDSCDFHDAER